MASLPDLRSALASQLNGIQTVAGNLLTAYPTFPPSYTFPCVVVGAHHKGPAETFDGGHTWTFDLHIYTRATDLSYGQNEMDPLISDSDQSDSIDAAIENDPTLNGAVVFAMMEGFDSLATPHCGPGVIGGVNVLAWQLKVAVTAD